MKKQSMEERFYEKFGGGGGLLMGNLLEAQWQFIKKLISQARKEEGERIARDFEDRFWKKPMEEGTDFRRTDGTLAHQYLSSYEAKNEIVKWLKHKLRSKG